MPSKPDMSALSPLPASFYRTIPIDIRLTQGAQPMVSIHQAVHSVVDIRSRLVRIAAQIKALDAAGAVFVSRDTLSVPVSPVTCSRRPWIKDDGEEIPYRHCPDPNMQIVARPCNDTTPHDLVTSYEELAQACELSRRIGDRLDSLMRQHAEIPYEVDGDEVDIWTTISTGGVPGWTTRRLGTPQTVEFDYLVYSDG